MYTTISESLVRSGIRTPRLLRADSRIKIHSTIIGPVVCGSFVVKLRGGCWGGGIFESRREDMTAERRQARDKELQNLYAMKNV